MCCAFCSLLHSSLRSPQLDRAGLEVLQRQLPNFTFIIPKGEIRKTPENGLIGSWTFEKGLSELLARFWAAGGVAWLAAALLFALVAVTCYSWRLSNENARYRRSSGIEIDMAIIEEGQAG